jgi:hypothetical protein
MLPIIVVTVINVIFESSHLTAEILADKYLSLAHLKFKFPFSYTVTEIENISILFSFLWYTGLVGQQIDSFDEFIRYTIQELVYDTGEITMTPEDQFIIGQDVAQVSFCLCVR